MDNKKNNKHGEIRLSYFKQGDDFHTAKEHSKSNQQALREHANSLDYSANKLRQIANIIEECGEEDLDITGDTHMIWIEGPEPVVQKLMDAELVDRDPFEEEYEELEAEDDYDETIYEITTDEEDTLDLSLDSLKALSDKIG